MRTIILLLAAAFAATAQAGEWEVSDADSFGWRRALIAAGESRLAVVCPPGRAPFAVPVLAAAADGAPVGRFTLGLEVDGERHDQPMTCSRVLCEADLSPRAWEALVAGREVTLWIDERRGPSFSLAGSAAALRLCSPDY
jgi:hypothetical protein